MVVFVGPWPRSLVVSPFFVRRNANLAGGFAGRPDFFGFWAFPCFVCSVIATNFDCTV